MAGAQTAQPMSDLLGPCGRRIKPDLFANHPPCSPMACESNIEKPRLTPAGTINERNIWGLCCESQEICNVVQDKILQSDDALLQCLAKGMEDHVWDAIKCPNANHVLQAFIKQMRQDHMGWIVRKIRAAVGEGGTIGASKHRFGCRVIQRLLQYGSPEMIKGLAAELLDNEALSLCLHKYGNYVMRAVLQHAAPDDVTKLLSTLLQSIFEVGADNNGVAVVCAAIESPSVNGKGSDDLARAILGSADLLAALSKTRHGNVTVKLARERLFS